MSVIRPLPAIRYNTSTQRDLSARIAPPYDVIDDAGKQVLLAQDPRNFVKLDLPHMPPKAAGPAAAYESARKELDAWLSDGTLTRDDKPAIYVYHQRYAIDGRPFVRKMFFARLRLEAFGSGSVFPHEQTFGGPKEDRLALTKACEANLSPIFGLYQDSENVVAAKLEAACGGEPLATGTLDDVENVLWAVTDAAMIDAAQQLMKDKPIFIADGHHRYGTALLYRDWLVEQQGELPADHPANFVLCVFCAMEDPGLQILPTHRVLPKCRVDAALLAGDERLDVQALGISNPVQVAAALAPLGPQALALYDGADRQYYGVRPKQANILDDVAPEHSPAWRKLGLAVLHAYVLDRVVTPQVCGGQAPEIHYVKAAEAAVAEAEQGGGAAFLMQATTMEEMRAVCEAGDLMPQKSTFFYPKLASGLIVNPLK